MTPVPTHALPSTGFKDRCPEAASAHGTENRYMTQEDFPEEYMAHFRAPSDWGRRRPHYRLIIDDSTRALAVSPQVRSANAAGAYTLLTLRDDESTMRAPADAVIEAYACLNIQAAEGIYPTHFIYGNEPEFNNQGTVGSSLYPDLQTYVHAEVAKGFDVRFAFGGLASWANGPDYAALWLGSFALHPEARARTDFYSAHEHRGHPATPHFFGIPAYIKRLFPWAQTACHETGLLPAAPLGLDTDEAACYTVLNCLTNASEGVPNCDFTLRNGQGVAGVGNGLFDVNGNPTPSGSAMLNIVAPFVQSPMRRARTRGVATAQVFANARGEIVLATSPEESDKLVKAAFNQARLGRPGWVTASAMYDYASTANATIESPPTDQADLDPLRMVSLYEESLDLVSTARKETVVRLPSAPGSAKILTQISGSSTGDAEVRVVDDLLIIEHDRYAVVHLKVSA